MCITHPPQYETIENNNDRKRKTRTDRMKPFERTINESKPFSANYCLLILKHCFLYIHIIEKHSEIRKNGWHRVIQNF